MFRSDDGSDTEQSIIMTMSNSIEFEFEMKLRLASMVASTRAAKLPSTMYVGMFAGAEKPKPFQRKRPNISTLPPGKLPTLHDMRTLALSLHSGSYRPCPNGFSRRIEIALQHIYEGLNIFTLKNVRGPATISNQYRSDSLLVISDESLSFKPRGFQSDTKIEFSFDDMEDWRAIDNDNQRSGDSGIEIISRSGDKVYFGVEFIRDVKHTLEYFWNLHKVDNGMGSQVKLGSTHGRPIVSVTTLSGELPPPADSLVVGMTDVVDQDGIVVRPGGKVVPRRGSMVNAKDVKMVPLENRAVKAHWHKVVMHQGWLLKQGGVGVGSIKSWIKRYFVLYKTSQGHFLVYYSDFTECPMYTAEQNHRNYVDLAKCTFIRPIAEKKPDVSDPPPAHSFDIVTTEREWTLCAESQENALLWLKLLTRAVDEDVAILPDEELIFKVKPKVDPLGVLSPTDYSTSLKVSAYGISVCTPQPNGKDGQEIEHYFWVYTDFYKWSLLSQSGKLALLVNVFADASFSRRVEYIFRHKEAKRLATAIEYFIEKFMSLMHIHLETIDGAFDEVPDAPADTGRLHSLSAEDVAQEEELDLLGLDLGGEVPVAATTKPGAQASLDILDIFDEPFESKPLKANNDPPLLFGDSSLAHTAHTTMGGTVFDNRDPFGDDPFGFSSTIASSTNKVAAPLTPQQIAQHDAWLVEAIEANGGPLYDDDSLQLSTKIEVRGSQCRLTFMYINHSSATLSSFKVDIIDQSGLVRFELAALPIQELAVASKVSQILMCECIKPSHHGLQVSLSYFDPLHGQHSHTMDLPVQLLSFNEPLSLSGSDFMSKWQLLTNAGQEVQEVVRPTTLLAPNKLLHILGAVSKLVICMKMTSLCLTA